MNLSGLESEIARVPGRACRDAALIDDYDDYSPRAVFRLARMQLSRIERLIAETKEALTYLEKHTHQWNTHDYCDVCGAGGRERYGRA